MGFALSRKTVEVDAMIDPTAEVAPAGGQNDWRRMRYPYYADTVVQIDRARMWDQGGDLSMRRTDRIEQWVAERSDLACIYAQCEEPATVVELKNSGAIQGHWKVVRALVRLDK